MMWRKLALLVDYLFGRTFTQDGRALYSQNEVWHIQAALPDVMRQTPRYEVLAVGRYGQIEAIDHWNRERGVLLSQGVWMPGKWIDSTGHTDGPMDPGDTWIDC